MVESFRRLRYFIKSEIINRRSFTLDNSILICGEPRSGSTWVSEVLAKSLGYVVNWEPLHLEKGLINKEMNLGWVPYLKENEKNDKLKSLIEDSLTLKRFNEWTLITAELNQLAFADKVISKFVRANLLLPWISQNIDLAHKPLYLLRHPIPSALSWLKHFDNNASDFSIPECKNNERFLNNATYIDSLESNLLKQIALWCINNKTTLSHPSHGEKWTVSYYEKLVSDPQREFSRILEKLRLPENDIKEKKVRKRSGSDFKNDFSKDSAKQIGNWENTLSLSEKNRIQEVFDFFEIKEYSAHSALPIK